MANLVACLYTRKYKNSSLLFRNFKIIIGFVVWLVISLDTKAGGLEKAFDALKIHDYFRAKSTFYKALKKDSAAAAYGLSVIYSRNNNPFYNLDSALLYAKTAVETYSKGTSEKQKIRYKVLAVDSVTVLDQRVAVDATCFLHAENQNTIDGYTYFLLKNKGAKETKQASLNRNLLAFTIAKEINTSQAYQQFMTAYPQAHQLDEVVARYQKTLFKEYTIDGTLESNLKFIKEQPANFYVTQAQKNIYQITTVNKTVKEYENFIKNYPKNPSVSSAWRNVYRISTQVRTAKNIQKFLTHYADYPFKEELEEVYVLSTVKYYPIKTNGKWGFVNEDLKMVIPTIYTSVSNFREGASTVALNGKMGFINKKNLKLFPFEYDEVEPFFNGIAIVGNADKYGLINRSGELIVPLIYDEIGATANEFIYVELDGNYGFIDHKGDLKVGLEYEAVGDFNNGIAYVKKNGLYGIIDTNLLYVVKPKYQWIDNLNNNFIRIRENGLYGAINWLGDSVLAPIYEQLSEVNNGFAMGVKQEEYVYLKPTGKLVDGLSFPVAEGVINWGLFDAQGYARILVNGKFGLIDTTGKRFVPALFEDVGQVSTEMIAVKRYDKWGYCDYGIQLKIPYNFSYATHFVGDYALVKKEEFSGLIDKKGNYKIDPIYEEMSWFKERILLVKKNGFYGLITIDQTIVLPAVYEKIEVAEDQKMLILHSRVSFEYQPIDSIFCE
jgi:hypothetical protein